MKSCTVRHVEKLRHLIRTATATRTSTSTPTFARTFGLPIHAFNPTSKSKASVSALTTQSRHGCRAVGSLLSLDGR